LATSATFSFGSVSATAIAVRKPEPPPPTTTTSALKISTLFPFVFDANFCNEPALFLKRKE
jgi:hypothetical protein